MSVFPCSRTACQLHYLWACQIVNHYHYLSFQSLQCFCCVWGEGSQSPSRDSCDGRHTAKPTSRTSSGPSRRCWGAHRGGGVHAPYLDPDLGHLGVWSSVGFRSDPDFRLRLHYLSRLLGFRGGAFWRLLPLPPLDLRTWTC